MDFGHSQFLLHEPVSSKIKSIMSQVNLGCQCDDVVVSRAGNDIDLSFAYRHRHNFAECHVMKRSK